MASKPVKNKISAKAGTAPEAVLENISNDATPEVAVEKIAAPKAKVVAKAKKAPVKAAAKPAVKSSVKPAVKTASIIPFSEAFDPLKSITNSNFSNFNQAIPSFDGAYATMETTMNNFKNQYEQFTGGASSSVREGVESFSKSSATFAKGAEQILKTIAEVAQESSQRNAEAVKALMATRTLNEFAEAQNKLAQQNFDEAMSTMTKLSEMTIKLYSEALEPINGQVTKAMSAAMKKNAA